MGVVVSSSPVVSAAPSSSGGGLLILFTSCSSVGPLQGYKSCHQTCSSVGSSLHGATGPARSLLQRGLPTGSQPPSDTFTCAGVGSSSMGCRWRSALPWTSMGARRSLAHHGLHHGLQGNLCSGAWSTSFPSFLTDLGLCRVVSLTDSHSSL